MPSDVSPPRDPARKALRGAGRLLLPRAPLDVRMLDVSPRRVGLVAPANVAVGTSCILDFSLPHDYSGRQRIEVGATVTDCVLSACDDGFRLGMRFDATLAEETRQAIDDYVRMHS